jgi:hypothetical protein
MHEQRKKKTDKIGATQTIHFKGHVFGNSQRARIGTVAQKRKAGERLTLSKILEVCRVGQRCGCVATWDAEAYIGGRPGCAS